MILQDVNEQLSKEVKKIKLCKESIMKSQAIIQISTDHKRRLIFTKQIREKERRTSLKEKETKKIC